jgi:predicted nucleic acid-binding Zn ribbon protein
MSALNIKSFFKSVMCYENGLRSILNKSTAWTPANADMTDRILACPPETAGYNIIRVLNITKINLYNVIYFSIV